MPKILKIVTLPDKRLREKSIAIEKEIIGQKDFQNLLSDMTATMLDRDGIGLAAPQIGKNIRAVVINTKDGPLHLINPIITKRSWAKERGEEGCLSVPRTFGQVKRCKKITCRFIGQDQKPHTVTAGGLMARVFQHEIDHLDAILFIDLATDIKILMPEKEED